MINQFVLTGEMANRSGIIKDNLYGSWLLQTALERDEPLQRLLVQLNRLDSATASLVTATSALGVAQGITAYNQNNNMVSNNLGLIGSVAPFAALGCRGVILHRLKKQVAARQSIILGGISDALTALESGQPSELVQLQLQPWVGERVAGQFLKLWQLTETPSIKPGLITPDDKPIAPVIP